MVHIFNGLLLSHKKEQNCAICSDVDRPRVCHRELSKSEREKQISYHIVYMQNPENDVGCPWWSRGYESAWQGRERGVDPWSGRIPHAAEQLSPCATLLSLSATAWSLGALEPSLCNKRSHCNENRALQPESSPSSLQLEKVSTQLQRPSTANKQINKKCLKKERKTIQMNLFAKEK